ncbi:MAG TPA: XRE family transcriptional regulator [Allosphingosinicella sp.]|jgi:HTH-type transcriptional regulator/antitoxin HigA|nr:XRE family transcriptional regulator [Allosphingosinicella sp.]
MIKNEKEYKTTKAALAAYEDALSQFNVLRLIERGVSPVIAEAQKGSYERQINELREKIAAYDSLKNGEETHLVASDIGELGHKLISARIAKGLTQREFANLAGLKEQQIQRYEKEAYASANLRRLSYLAGVLGVKFTGEMRLQSRGEHPSSDFLNTLNPTDFPMAEMNKRGWFDRRIDLRSASAEEKKRCLAGFFANVGIIGPSAALHRKSKGQVCSVRRASLLAWQARVLAAARSKASLARRFTPPPPEFISELVKLSRIESGPGQAVSMLLEYGIILIFEKHLPTTKLDGAAMNLDGKYAVIGMTARHDRVDNFWFVLMHELGHVIRHWGPLLREGFIDEEGDDLQDTLEKEADDFAQNAIVSDEEWNSSFVRYTQAPETIVAFADRLQIHPALVAGRIRRERDSYKEFSDLLGRGTIRQALVAAGLLE